MTKRLTKSDEGKTIFVIELGNRARHSIYKGELYEIEVVKVARVFVTVKDKHGRLEKLRHIEGRNQISDEYSSGYTYYNSEQDYDNYLYSTEKGKKMAKLFPYGSYSGKNLTREEWKQAFELFGIEEEENKL